MKPTPVRCGCGGKAWTYIGWPGVEFVKCSKCGARSRDFARRINAVKSWNRAMSGGKKDD